MARILVVEDNSDNRNLIECLLRHGGHEVAMAFDGEAGIASALAESPELILMDLHLPGVDGYEATARLRQEPRLDDVPIVAVTAMAMVGDRDHILQAGFDGYVSKPLSPESFIREIEVFL